MPRNDIPALHIDIEQLNNLLGDAFGDTWTCSAGPFDPDIGESGTFQIRTPAAIHDSMHATVEGHRLRFPTLGYSIGEASWMPSLGMKPWHTIARALEGHVPEAVWSLQCSTSTVTVPAGTITRQDYQAVMALITLAHLPDA